MARSVAIIGTRGYPSYYGGFETLVRHLAPHLADCGWDVSVYGRTGATKTDDPARDPRVRTPTTAGVESKSLSTLTYGLTSSAHVAWRRPDVALAMNVATGYWLPLLRARGVPTLINVDGIEWERAKWGRAARAVFKGGAACTARFGDRLVFDSHEIERRWRTEFGRDGVFIPYGGADPVDGGPVNGLTSGQYVLMVARFVPENSVEEFFAAARELGRRWDVVIVGSSGYGGELDDHARRLADESDRVHWLGHVEDDEKLFALWRHAGVYFHGHSVGGTNPALVQAMACGAPIVARDTVFNREVLGDSGVFVQARSDAIIEAVEIILRDADLRDTLSCRARDRQTSRYSWSDVCRRYADALEAMSDSRGGARATSVTPQRSMNRVDPKPAPQVEPPVLGEAL